MVCLKKGKQDIILTSGLSDVLEALGLSETSRLQDKRRSNNPEAYILHPNLLLSGLYILSHTSFALFSFTMPDEDRKLVIQYK